MQKESLRNIERISLGTGIIAFTQYEQKTYVVLMPNLRMLSQGKNVLTPLAAGGISSNWETINRVTEQIDLPNMNSETRKEKEEADFRFSFLETDLSTAKQALQEILLIAQPYIIPTLKAEAKEELTPSHKDRELEQMLEYLKLSDLLEKLNSSDDLFIDFQRTIMKEIEENSFVDIEGTRTRIKRGTDIEIPTLSLQRLFFSKIDFQDLSDLMDNGYCSFQEIEGNSLISLIPLSIFEGYQRNEDTEEYDEVGGIKIATSTLDAINQNFDLKLEL